VSDDSLAAALEREHQDIDDEIEVFAAGLAAGTIDAGPLRRASAALRRHIYLEEEFLFPPLREAGLVAPVFVMLREHGELWRILDAIDTELALDPDTAALQKLCRELVVQLQHHNPKEEQILYPQADQVLHGEVGSRLKAFIESGQLPEGWVCERR
jgi:iron-sulfur cluster repair protein YtfE (RIC family)